MSGTKSDFNSFFKITNDDWDTITDVLEGYLILNATEKYNNLVVAKDWTKTDPKDGKFIALTTYLYNIYRKTYAITTVQGGVVNITQTCTNTNGRDPNKSYIEGINNIESWIVNKSKNNIARDGQD